MIGSVRGRHPIGAEVLRLALLVVLACAAVLGLLPSLLDSAAIR
jgi:hypothetical protein